VQEIPDVAARQIKTVTEPPRLSVSLTNDVPQFTLRGGRGFDYAVGRSEDLRAWLSLAKLTVTNLNGTVTITDTSTPRAANRFYRALQVGP